jgi:hypothetical protein
VPACKRETLSLNSQYHKEKKKRKEIQGQSFLNAKNRQKHTTGKLYSKILVDQLSNMQKVYVLNKSTFQEYQVDLAFKNQHN